MPLLLSYNSLTQNACSREILFGAETTTRFTNFFRWIFSGFTVQPDVIPVYWIWAYWTNYFAWCFRGLVVNEFASGRYNSIINTTSGSQTEGEALLIQFGFVDSDDDPYTFQWAGWGVLFALMCAIVTVFCSVFFLTYLRFETGKSLVTDKGETNEANGDEEGEAIAKEVEIPFKPVDLTFKDIQYIVKASTSKEKLELLKGIDGVVAAGQMTALMGSSGAGKTSKFRRVICVALVVTCVASVNPKAYIGFNHFIYVALMDVLAMRKSSGEIHGEVRLNGHLQEDMSFRRATGYVVQFDTQTPQLTIRETCDFSAKLRLDESNSAVTPESISKFVDQTLEMLELSVCQDLQVGTDETGGLSFEQRKRLSIAVELVANPSILFLDEVRPISCVTTLQCDWC